jgi:hypothetical protein
MKKRTMERSVLYCMLAIVQQVKDPALAGRSMICHELLRIAKQFEFEIVGIKKRGAQAPRNM